MKTQYVALCFLLGACTGGDTTGVDITPPEISLGVQEVAGGFSNPLFLTSPPGDSRLFVVEQAGRIKIIKNGQVLATPFLDLISRVGSGGERGLLSVAFHPSYATNGFFYVNFTDVAGNTRVERFSVSSNPDVANASSSKLILAVNQPFPNHNGGLNVFGPDGMLYIGFGDGGSEGDPQGNGQKLSTLLGKILRTMVGTSWKDRAASSRRHATRPASSWEHWIDHIIRPGRERRIVHDLI